ncbi:TRAM domain-containing protein [Candidatus Woesearchaeota archaeon]|nr:TRAM domain-containing protein [Candidatus Woesearchaeota archaeon]
MRKKMLRPPVNVGDVIEVKIEAVGEKGDGIGKIKGFVLFVPGAKEGETCKVRVNKMLKKVGFADKVSESEPVTVETPKEEAVMPPPPPPPPEAEATEDFGEEEEAPQEPEEQPAEEPQEEQEEKPAE